MTVRPRSLLALGATVLVAAIGAPAAQAGMLVSSATACDEQSLSQPFAPWLDPASYTPAPDGGLEAGGGGWTLAGAAGIAAGNEPWRVAGANDAWHLTLAGGSSATTRALCVGLGHPTLRFFARRTGGSLLATLRVDVLFEDAWGHVLSLPIGVVTGLTTAWQPTLPMPVIANLLPLLPHDRTAVAFRFTPQGGSWDVDDVYVDPWRRG